MAKSQEYECHFEGGFVISEASVDGKEYESGSDCFKEIFKIGKFKNLIKKLDTFVKWDLDSDYISNIKISSIKAIPSKISEGIVNVSIVFSFTFDQKVDDWDSEEVEDANYDLRNGFVIAIQDGDDFVNFLQDDVQITVN